MDFSLRRIQQSKNTSRVVLNGLEIGTLKETDEGVHWSLDVFAKEPLTFGTAIDREQAFTDFKNTWMKITEESRKSFMDAKKAACYSFANPPLAD